MADPQGRGSKRDRLLRPFQSGYDKLTKLVKSPSRPSSPLPGSSAALSAGGTSTPPVSTNTSDPQEASDLAKTHGSNKLGKAMGSTKPTTSLSPAPNTDNGAGSVALCGLGAALQILVNGAGALPPLKQALSGLIACLDISVTDRGEEYEQLTSELTTIANTLNRYIAELGPEDSDGTVGRIARAVEEEVARLKQQKARSLGRRMIENTQDKEDVIKSYRKIEALFRELQSDIDFRTWRNTNKLPLHYAMSLLQSMSPVDDAIYNSGYSTTVKRRGCTAETRQKVQADIQQWIQDPNGAKVYWMNGMAGTGKTTIAYSVCEWLETQHLLGGSFFCSRISSSCRNVNLIVPTIAHQLALASPPFQLGLCKVLETNPGISKLNVVQQFENLIRQPLTTRRDMVGGSLVVVVDALDECEDNYGVQLILGTLLKHGTNLPLKFLITSRPEPAIQDKMLSQAGYSPTVLHLHDIEQSVVEEDIKKYLAESLGVMSPPPSTVQVEQLAALAGKLFIYAATAVRYITSGRGYAMSRLLSMLRPEPQSTVGQPSSNRYKELDELYAAVLAFAFDEAKFEAEERKPMQLVLWTVVCAKEPMTVPTLALFLDLAEDQVRAALDPLHSVVHVSEDRKLVSTLHASFPDYMLDRSRSKDYSCDEGKHNQLLAHRCFDIMQEKLRFNICGLGTSFSFDKDVYGLERRVKACISSVLFYACQHWSSHLRLADMTPTDELHQMLVDLLNIRLLFWVEVMNLKQHIAQGIAVLAQAESWLMAINANADSRKQASDARDFVARFAACACNLSTPHIYLSALPFCARTSTVYKHHWHHVKGLIDVDGTAISQRDRAARATWKTDSAINSIAISHDGTRVVSGSDDSKVRVWDIRTGNVVAGPFEGHDRSVNSVAFSSKSEFVASGSIDETIRVWNARTGDAIASPFKGHAGQVNSVAFSPDDTRIASGSNDATVRIWYAHTGDVAADPFEGHTSSVLSVVFSPDGTRIVSGSADKTVRVWDVRTGAVAAGPFEGHTDWVRSVAFAPDSTRIISGSDDQTIRVWDVQTGDVVVGPFDGHTGNVTSVRFSHDGTRIVSGSWDETIRIWDPRTGDTIAGPFIGHIDRVTSVAFSPDATHIVSGSDDGTIRVWDASMNNTSAGESQPPQAGHSHFVNSVAFSPSGAQIVSGSRDNTIRIWDGRTGNLVAGPFKGHTEWVRSVAFSPDGARIVSGSDDRTICVWDAHTGDITTGPFEGHTGYVLSVAFSPDGALVVSGSCDCTIRVWDTSTGNATVGPLKGHTDWVRSVAFSPDGTRIVSGSDDKTIRVWDMHTGEVVTEPFKGHIGYVMSVAFSPDGACIVSGSLDHTIYVWDSHTGDVVAGPFKEHTGSVNSVAFSPDGTYIASGSEDKTVVVWEAAAGCIAAGPLKGHTRSINSVAFSPDGALIVSASDDQAIRVFSARPSPMNPEFHRQLLRHSTLTHTDSQDVSQSDPTPNVNPDDPPSDILIPASNAPQSTSMMDFECHDDGWVTSNGVPLFWTPPDLRTVIPYPQDQVVIGYPGSLSIDYQHALFGERWTECYNST